MADESGCSCCEPRDWGVAKDGVLVSAARIATRRLPGKTVGKRIPRRVAGDRHVIRPVVILYEFVYLVRSYGAGCTIPV